MSSQQSLPSLGSLMRGSLLRDAFGDSRMMTYGKHSVGQSIIADVEGIPSTGSHQYAASGQKHLSVQVPRPAMHVGLSGPENGMSSTDSIAGAALAIPSPITPRLTRCPSLSESIFPCGTSASPLESGPTTPSSDHDHSSYGFDDERNSPHRLRRSFDSRYMQSPSNPHASSHSLHYANSNETLSFGLSDSRGVHMMKSDGMLMSDHHDERITKQEKRRRNHLNSEKRRRENIKGGMDALVDLVPSCRNLQESKANILKKTRDYILSLQDCQRRLAKENEQLRSMLRQHSQSSTYPASQQLQTTERLVFRPRS